MDAQHSISKLTQYFWVGITSPLTFSVSLEKPENLTLKNFESNFNTVAAITTREKKK